MSYHVSIITPNHDKLEIPEEQMRHVLSNHPKFLSANLEDGYLVFLLQLSSEEEAPPTALFYVRGYLWAKNAEPDIIIELAKIATKLGAELIGDEGEVYAPDGHIEFSNQPAPQNNFRKFINTHGRKILAFIVFCLIVYVMT